VRTANVVARLTKAEARKLGLKQSSSSGTAPSAQGTRRRARTTYHTRCVTCEQRFTTEASEERHLRESGHHRYELVLDGSVTS